MRRSIVIVCLCFALLLNLGDAALGAGALPKLTMQYWDELYDIARTTLKITVNKGDDFVRFIQRTNKIDDIARLVTKLPISKRTPLLLEICAVQGKISPTDVLRLQPLLKAANNADSVLIAAMRNGDDVAEALRAAAQTTAPLSKLRKLKSVATGAAGAIAGTAKAALGYLAGFAATLGLQLWHLLLMFSLFIMAMFWKFFVKISASLFRLVRQAVFSPMRK